MSTQLFILLLLCLFFNGQAFAQVVRREAIEDSATATHYPSTLDLKPRPIIPQSRKIPRHCLAISSKSSDQSAGKEPMSVTSIDVHLTSKSEARQTANFESRKLSVYSSPTVSNTMKSNRHLTEMRTSTYSNTFSQETNKFIPVSEGDIALSIYTNVKNASTETIFSGAPTLSASYESGVASVSGTKENPILDLTVLHGPNEITISDWSSASETATGFGSSSVYEGASVTESLNFVTDTNIPISSMISSTVYLLSFGMHPWNQSITDRSKSHRSERGHSSSVTSDAITSSRASEKSAVHSRQSSVSSREPASSSILSSSSLDRSRKSSATSSHMPSLIDKTLTFASKPLCNSHKNLFEKIADVNPAEFHKAKDHPIKIPPGVSNLLPFQTNRFYTNMFMGEQTGPVYTYPYIVYWEKTDFFGMGIQNVDIDHRVYDGVGAQPGTNKFYYNPPHRAGLFIGATSIKEDSCHLRMSDMKSLSAEAKISSESDFNRYIAFPLVEGMGFVTAVYHGDLIPKIQGREGILTFERLRFSEKSSNTQFYRAKGGNLETWLISVTLPNIDETFELSKNQNGAIHYVEGSKAVDGLIIQIAITSESDFKTEKVYQQAAGMYVTGTKISGSVSCETVDYKIQYETKGSSKFGKPIIFALPHHIGLFDERMNARAQQIIQLTTTKGTMQGYLSDELLFSHEVDNKVQWLPYLKRNNEKLKYTKEQIELIRETAKKELEGVDIEQTVLDIDSHYFAGKALDKFAYLLYVVDEFLEDKVLTKNVLNSLKRFFETFREREGDTGFFYDTKFGGVTSKSAFRNVKNGKVDPQNINIDFGNGLYNDHNFHYSYYIHAAAVVGKIDKKFGGNWVADNKDFINTFVRDVANPSEEDSFFPVFRLFDIFQGHSWAHGITPVTDGKDLESTSEDVNFSYAMKMWGQVIGDEAMEARGNLMLSIQTASFNLYFQFQDGNTVVAPSMLKNRVSGILFEAKLAYETWFGGKTEFIHGIQMLPLTPALGLVRNADFARTEWDEILGKLGITGQWAGVLNSNRVFFDPKSAWNYFANPSFKYNEDMDGGQSRTWNLVFAAPFVNQQIPHI